MEQGHLAKYRRNTFWCKITRKICKNTENEIDSEIVNGRYRYSLGYSTRRHRNMITSIKGDEHSNFFEEVKVIFKSLYKGEPRLALPALRCAAQDSK